MKRYIVTAEFKSLDQIKRTMKDLESIGIDSKDIDYISSTLTKRHGFRLSKSSRGSFVSFKFMSFGLLFGLFLFFTLLDQPISNDNLQSFLSSKIFQLLATTSFFGVFFSFLGFLVGKKQVLHFVKFDPKERSKCTNYLLGFNSNFQELNKVKTKIKNVEFETIDISQEIELGMRYQ